ncbi:hypothetical protein SteCoe_20721 [Stentor coeruleus]|uniref:Uncharacterized protein n=1 Tax=Stentor coeruleus TaxID=5963 RepID=A0A1R2BR72_9CILI|nr:hypothetical protein SteCoe_20721 [Stentor coeruleus]
MGCIAFKSTAESVLEQISQKKQQIKEIESMISKPISIEMNYISTKPANIDIAQELQMSLYNFKTLSNNFPVDSIKYNRILTKFITSVNNFVNDNEYVILKLEESDYEKTIAEHFASLVENINELDKNLAQQINNKYQSLEKILTTGKHTSLLIELDKIKSKEIQMSSFRGGKFDNIAMRVSARLELGKDLEIIQTKLENEQHINSLNYDEIELTKLKNEITLLRNQKNDLERAWDVVKINSKSRAMKVSQLYKEVEETKLVNDDIKIQILEMNERKEKFHTNIIQIKEFNMLIREINQNIEEKKIELYNIIQENLIKSQKYKESKDLKGMIYKNIQEKSELEAKIAKVESFTKEKYPGYEDNMDKLLKLNNCLDDLPIMLLEKSENIAEQEKYHLSKLKNMVIIRLKYSLNKHIDGYFSKWKLISENGIFGDKSIISNMSRKSINDIPDSDSFNADDNKIASQSIEEVNKEFIENNELIKNLNEINEKPMSIFNLFKFLEELMDKKYETDLKDIKEGRMPGTMTEFIQEHLLKVFGVTRIASRQLGSIIPTLKELHQQKNPYGNLYCQLFQIFDPNPLNLHMAIFITRARYQFELIKEKYEKIIIPTSRKRNTRDMTKEAKIGGYAFVTDVIDLIKIMFENKKEIGIITLKLLRPENLSLEEYVIFMICQKINRIGKTVESVFNLIDKDLSLTIDKDELIFFTGKYVDLWVDEEDMNKCFSSLVTAGTNEIAKEVFMAKFGVKTFQELARNENYIVSKSKFLTSLVKVYKIIHKKTLASISSMLNSYPNELSKQDFVGLMNKLNPEMIKYFDKYFSEISNSNEFITHQAFLKFISKNGLGAFKQSPFAITDLYKGLEEKRVKTTLDDSFLKLIPK